jgi:hypothetical protein
MQVTDRDLRIMEWVHECRFLTREQVQRLEFGTGAASSCKRRLTLLYHHGYLGRVFLPLRDAYGASKAVYCLDQAGAHCLAQVQWRPLGELDWRRRNGLQEEFFLAHALDINDVRIAFTVACRGRGLELDWLDERALRRLQVLHRRRGRGGETVTLLPDAYFTITGPDCADGFALEVDRGTVPERRIRARVRGYGEWGTSGAYRSHLPSESLRVVFAVTDCTRDTRRLAHLKRWCEEEGGRTLFWFADRNGLEEDVLAAPVWWVAGDEQRHRLALGSDQL